MARQTKKHAVPHLLERFKGKHVMELLRKAGTHFDVGKTKSHITELIALDGLFSLKDVQDRLPIPDRRLSNLIQDPTGHFSSCFVTLYKTATKNSGTVHVDLKRLCHLLQEQFLSMEPLKPDIVEDT